MDICIAGGTRTPLGNFGGSLRDVEMTDMAGHAARATMERAGVDPGDVDHMVFATTCPNDRDSLFANRVVGVKSGIPETAGPLLGRAGPRHGPRS